MVILSQETKHKLLFCSLCFQHFPSLTAFVLRHFLFLCGLAALFSFALKYRPKYGCQKTGLARRATKGKKLRVFTLLCSKKKVFSSLNSFFEFRGLLYMPANGACSSYHTLLCCSS